jgi:hypothetical protein
MSDLLKNVGFGARLDQSIYCRRIQAGGFCISPRKGIFQELREAFSLIISKGILSENRIGWLRAAD